MKYSYWVWLRSCVVFVLIGATQGNAETLEQAWVEAYKLNPSLQAERANLRATDESVSQALSHYRPSVDATASVGRTDQKSPVFDGDFTGNTRLYGLQVTQPLFRGFRTVGEVEAAEKQVKAERAKLESAEQQLLLDTATAFLNVVRDTEILADERRNEQVLAEKLEETRVRAAEGDLTHTDIRQAEARLARAKVSRFQAENSLAEDNNNYERLVGHRPDHLELTSFHFALPAQLDQLLQQAQTNPDVMSARYAVEVAQANRTQAQGGLLPEINLVGNTNRDYGQSASFPARQDSSQILVQATIPLYRSGADYSRTRQAEQVITQKKMEWQEALHKTQELANNSWQNWLTAKAAVTADEDGVKAAGQALEGVKVESKAGTRTTLDVLNAEQELLDAEIGYARSQHDERLAEFRIHSAVGKLTVQAMNLPVNTPYNPTQHYDDVREQWAGFSQADERYAVSSTLNP